MMIETTSTGEEVTATAMPTDKAKNNTEEAEQNPDFGHHQSPVRQRKELWESIFQQNQKEQLEHQINTQPHQLQCGELVKSRHKWIEGEHLRKSKNESGITKKHAGVYRLAAFRHANTEDKGSAFMQPKTPVGTKEKREVSSNEAVRERYDDVRDGTEESDEAPPESTTTTLIVETTAVGSTAVEAMTVVKTSSSISPVLEAAKSASPVQEMKEFFEQLSPQNKPSSPTLKARSFAVTKKEMTPASKPIAKSSSTLPKKTVKSSSSLSHIKSSSTLPKKMVKSSSSLSHISTPSIPVKSRNNLSKTDPTLLSVKSAPIPEISFNDNAESPQNPLDVSDLVTDSQGEDIHMTSLLKLRGKLSKVVKKKVQRRKSTDESIDKPTVSRQVIISSTIKTKSSKTSSSPPKKKSPKKKDRQMGNLPRNKSLVDSVEVEDADTTNIAATDGVGNKAAATTTTTTTASNRTNIQATTLSPTMSHDNDEWKLVRVDSHQQRGVDYRCLDNCGIL